MTATKQDQSPALVIITWLATRLVIVTTIAYTMITTGQSLEQSLNHWDVRHFITIAEQGYAEATDIAFFPGLPLILRLISVTGIPMAIGGAILAQVASALAAWALHRMFGPTAASLWLLAPMTVFTAVAYTEAFFCAAAFWSWQRATVSRWGQAALLASFACALRVSGGFLLVGLAVLALTQTGHSWQQRFKHVALLILPGLVIVAYMVYLAVTMGSWDAWYTAQNQGWQRNMSWPWQALETTWPMTREDYWPGRPEVPIMFRFEIVSVAIGYVTVIICLLVKRWAESAWVAANVIPLSCSGWFLSVNRAVLLWFPFFVIVAKIVEWEPSSRVARITKILGLTVLLVADIVIMVWWTWLFCTGRWSS